MFDPLAIKKIRIFDLDGTMVFTPLKPANWIGGWWGRATSLLPPYMPSFDKLAEEGADLLNKKVADEYHAACACPETFAVIMTGRHPGLKWAVTRILEAYGILPEDSEKKRLICISGGGGHQGNQTLQLKLEEINKMVVEFPNSETIEIWEDREEHIKSFREYESNLKKIRDNLTIRVYEPPDWI